MTAPMTTIPVKTTSQKLLKIEGLVLHFKTRAGTVQAVDGVDFELDTNRAVVDRLWNRFVAAWYEGGKDDPKLALLRLDPDRGEVWLNGSSLVAGVKMLMGVDPKKSYRDKVAQVDLH